MCELTNHFRSIVLLPCGGLSVRGRIAHQASMRVLQGLEDVLLVNFVPLMAKIPESLAQIRDADFVMTLSGCSQRCELKACVEILNRKPDDSFLVGDIVPQEIREASELSEEEIEQYVLEVASQVSRRLSTL